jgi:hypothetical protein
MDNRASFHKIFTDVATWVIINYLEKNWKFKVDYFFNILVNYTYL